MNKKSTILKMIPLLAPAASLLAAIPAEDRQLILNTTIGGVLIVLFALFVVAFGVGIMSKIIRIAEQRKAMREAAKKSEKELQESGDEDAVVAIAAALHLEMRSRAEDQKAILTITKALRPFSGWNNKAYGMRSVEVFNK